MLQSNMKDSRLGTGSVDGPSVLMEGVRGQHGHHNQLSNDKEEKRFVCNFTLTITKTIPCYLCSTPKTSDLPPHMSMC